MANRNSSYGMSGYSRIQEWNQQYQAQELWKIWKNTFEDFNQIKPSFSSGVQFHNLPALDTQAKLDCRFFLTLCFL